MRGLTNTLIAADPDEVAPVQISLCGTNAIDALFASSHEIRTAFITDWGCGVADFQSSLAGKPRACMLSFSSPEVGFVHMGMPYNTLQVLCPVQMQGVGRSCHMQTVCLEIVLSIFKHNITCTWLHPTPTSC